MPQLESGDTRRLIGQESGQTARLMAYILVSIVLMAMDQRGQYVAQFRSVAGTVLEPVFYLVDGPSRAYRAARDYTRSLAALREENRRLDAALSLQAGSLQRLDALNQENQRLRALLDAASGREFEYRFAEMVQVSLDPLSHQVMIDQGSQEGVFEGQAVIDGAGVIGQVETVLRDLAQVRLISDPDHALPVQVNRTGLRTVAFGTGFTESLLLPNVPLQADIRVGDLLETSGLGDRFPPGFPVARVTAVEREEGGTFARVRAAPLAALDRGREVLLVRPVPAEVIEQDAPAESEPATDENGGPEA